ncbi:hypothetical protein DW1_0308 [Proteiniborus sp. DW1]|uniref:CDP-glycerol glycerophosphotransferase family protein n=1 Tax=Proteiniborus sp. DW1 TaxID=1889883 RepID=UPI00092E06AC|nr:CDP-glycerol glycerophosphotransferase family protein [Proteiniborus sp. DW1]SCG81928.1 hypothetical protein DW1_0308 [Proteiniborus sp. DW1]
MDMRGIESVLNECERLRELVYPESYILKRLKDSSNVAIWGTGEHTEHLLKVLDIDKINLKCFIDSNQSKWGKEFHNFKIYPPKAITELQIDSVIISSCTYSSEISAQILRNFPNCKYVDLYSELEYNRPFYYVVDDLKPLYEFYTETCLLIKIDLESLKVSIDNDMLRKLDEFIEDIDVDRKGFEKNIKLTSLEYVNTYLRNSDEDCNCETKKKIKVAFFIQNPNTWSSTESVYEAMIEDDRADVKVIQLPFIHRYSTEYNGSRNLLLKKQIAFIPWYLYNIEEDRPDIVIYHSPYDATRPSMYSVESIKKLGIKIIYIPYCQELFGGDIAKWFFNNDIHRDAWKIYVRSEKYKKMFKKNSLYNGENLVVTGHPKFDSMAKLKDFEVNEYKRNLVKNKTVFLWNPHFYANDGVSNSTFNTWKSFILSLFEKRDDLFLIIRPHPLLLGGLIKLNNGDTTEVDNFRKAIKNMKNVILDESDDYRESFVLSDALISDTSSFLLTYMPTCKPILHLIGENTIKLNEDGQDIASVCYKGSTKEDILNYIDMVVDNKDPLYHLRISKLREHLTYFDCNCGYRIKEDMLNSFSESLSEL